jgi:hypothetical protein
MKCQSFENYITAIEEIKKSCESMNGKIVEGSTCPAENLLGTCSYGTAGPKYVVYYYDYQNIKIEEIKEQCTENSGTWKNEN